MSFFSSKKKSELPERLDDLTESIDLIKNNLDEMSKSIKEVQELMVKMWRAEDMEENDGKFRWPFDEHGNLLDNVNISRRLN
ncbi:hypothetical protein HOE22_07955 [Candidatus Woesearchaeota archaeon]|jgi:hypothetical protein|nr:hypothetical protein [Candidatus Woesearchaeota archaeon]MBT7557009.1 hypothetical protein [Candidatus Woesearchaeota archaeon]|tara:strand:+ start:1529 stop:1774 length:246 start_codon:yes stop_codon:yes gene_type:complete